MSAQVDVGIVTIIPAEVDAVFRVFGISREEDRRELGTLEYWLTSIYSEASESMIKVAVSFISGNAGNIESAALTSILVEKLRPRLMCLVGIAAGAEKKIAIGDVVLPDVVHDVTVNVRKNGVTQPRTRQSLLDQRLNRELKVAPFSNEIFASSLPWTETQLAQLKQIATEQGLSITDIGDPPRLKDGSLVSGNTLLRDRSYFPEFHQTNDERCRVGEMEAAGFARACELARCGWLIVRGVSDYGDDRKSDDFQAFAAMNAAVALRQLLDRNIPLKIFPRGSGASELDFPDSLERSLSEEYARSNWNPVVEIGAFLSRPLWLSGKLELRRRIGVLVEDAAANIERPLDRARALVDDIGWTSYVMGDATKARKAIRDGLRIAKELDASYICAKACRHLASISRQEGDLSKCEQILSQAEEHTAQISDQGEREEMQTSLLVSRAKLLTLQERPAEAITHLEAAQRQFETANDYLRAAKTYHSLGLAYRANGDIPTAFQTHERGYRLAEKLGRRDEQLANASALALLLDEMEDAASVEWAYRAAEVASELADAKLDARLLEVINRPMGAADV